jgi:hypothetical protein
MVKSLKIGSNRYPVKQIRGSRFFGFTTHPSPGVRPLIEINGDAPCRDRYLTLLHEGLHAVMTEYGINFYLKSVEGDEALVRLLETAITLLFTENKQFAREFVKAVSKA